MRGPSRKRSRCRTSVVLEEGQGESTAMHELGCGGKARACSVSDGFSLEHLPEGLLEAISEKLGVADRAALRLTSRLMRASCNAVTRVVRLSYRDQTPMPWELLERLGCKLDVPSAQQALAKRRRRQRGELSLKAQAQVVVAAFPSARSLVVAWPPPTASRGGNSSEGAGGGGSAPPVMQQPLFLQHQGAAAYQQMAQPQEPPLLDVGALGPFAALRLESLTASPYVGPDALPPLVDALGATLRCLTLEHTCLPLPPILECVVGALPELRCLKLSASRRRTADSEDIHLFADHVNALSRTAGHQLQELHLRGFKLHGNVAGWRDALAELPANFKVLRRLSLVDKPRHLTPTPQLSSCDLLGPLSRLPALEDLRLHMGYCCPCTTERRCPACLPGGRDGASQRHGAAAATAAAGSGLAPAGGRFASASACGLPPAAAAPPASSASPFPALRHAELQNGYQFNAWVGPTSGWLSCAPLLQSVLVATHVVDEQLAGLSDLGGAEVHLHWQLPYSLQPLAPLAGMPNLTALSLGTTSEAPLLRGLDTVAALSALTRLELLGGVTWDDARPPEHFFRKLPGLQVCKLPGYLCEEVQGPAPLRPLLDLSLAALREGCLRGTGGLGAYRIQRILSFTITMEHVASWSDANRRAMLQAGAVAAAMEMIESELAARLTNRVSTTMAHSLACLANLTELRDACHELVRASSGRHLAMLLQLLRRCCAHSSAAFLPDGERDDTPDLCKASVLRVLLRMAACGHAEAIARCEAYAGGPAAGDAPGAAAGRPGRDAGHQQQLQQQQQLALPLRGSFRRRSARTAGGGGSSNAGGAGAAGGCGDALAGLDIVIQLLSRRGSEACKALAAQLLAVISSSSALMRCAVIERGGVSALWSAAETMLEDEHRCVLECALCSINVYEGCAPPRAASRK